MRVQRKEIKKPNAEKIRFDISDLTEEEFKAICNGLAAVKEEKAAAMLATFKELAGE